MTNPTLPVPRIEILLDGINGNVFPSNLVEMIYARFVQLDLDFNVVKRMPTTDDDNYTIGIVIVGKNPQQNTSEIGGQNFYNGATVEEYLLAIYAFVKDGDRERGMAAHAAMAEIVEHVLAEDAALRAGLGVLQSNVMGQVKRMQRFYIRNTRYLANEIGGNHLFMSATETVFEIEKVR